MTINLLKFISGHIQNRWGGGGTSLTMSDFIKSECWLEHWKAIYCALDRSCKSEIMVYVYSKAWPAVQCGWVSAVSVCLWVKYLVLDVRMFICENNYLLISFYEPGNSLWNVFWTPPPPINFKSDFFNNFQLNVRHVAAALGPLACPSQSARPTKCHNLT